MEDRGAAGRERVREREQAHVCFLGSEVVMTGLLAWTSVREGRVRCFELTRVQPSRPSWHDVRFGITRAQHNWHLPSRSLKVVHRDAASEQQRRARGRPNSDHLRSEAGTPRHRPCVGAATHIAARQWQTARQRERDCTRVHRLQSEFGRSGGRRGNRCRGRPERLRSQRSSSVCQTHR